MDLVVSNMSLHWVNDLPGTFTQVRKTLKPGIMGNGLLLIKKMVYFWVQCWERVH
jgi:NADH dehydrogenase [ubiquinone] 1 alpha subcomplex assembly factor 5